MKIEELLEQNKAWSKQMTDQDPRFFADLAGQQKPKHLWIGCCDSRVAANTIVGMMPGQILVHRNVANLVIHTDINCLSVIEFGVKVLQVEDIIVCGHYGCGGVQAALEAQRIGLIDNWLRHIQDTIHLHSAQLDSVADPVEKLDLLCELNVADQVINVGGTTAVQEAWSQGRRLQIHGWIYGLKDGIIRDLGHRLGSDSDLDEMRKNHYSNSNSPDSLTASN
jgi:carbonic anhydrase